MAHFRFSPRVNHKLRYLGQINTNQEIISNPKLIERIQEEIDELNKKFGSWEQIKRFELTPDVWSIDAGHLTPTMKLRRKIVMEKYNDLYKKIYNS